MGDVCIPLTDADKRKSLSSKKYKKSAVKFVLDTPLRKSYNQFPKLSLDDELNHVLKSNLSSARLNTSEIDNEKSKAVRKDLCIGINSVSRQLRASNLSAVLLACDVSPEMMIGHVFEQCQQNKVPTIRLEAMRQLTLTALGFECIALGFIKGRDRFASIISAIEELSPFTGTICESTPSIEIQTLATEIVGNKDDGSKMIEAPMVKNVTPKKKEKDLVVKNATERNISQVTPSNSKAVIEGVDDFIALGDEEMEFDRKLPKGISYGICKGSNWSGLVDLSSDEEIVEEPRKKLKKKWTIDTQRQYIPPNVLALSSNPERKLNFRKNFKRKR